MAFSWLILLFNIGVTVSSNSNNCDLDLNEIIGGKYEFIDLTFPLDEWKYGLDDDEINALNWPHSQKGTYFRSPSYRQRDLYVTDIAPESLLVQLIVIDVSRNVEEDPKYVLHMNDVNSDIFNNMKSWPTLIVFKFGWSRYYNEDPRKYIGYDMAKGSYYLRTLSSDIAEWITSTLADRKVLGIGTDLTSVDAGANNSTYVQDIITNAGLYIIDGLNLSYSVPSNKCIAVVSPLKIQQGVAPVNVLAICPKESLKDQSSIDVTHKHRKRDTTEHEHGHGCGHHGHAMGHGMDDEMQHSMKNGMAHEMGMENEMKQMQANGTQHSDKQGNSEMSNGNQENKNSGGNENKQPEHGSAKPNNSGESDKQPSVYDGSPKIIGGISKVKEKIDNITS